MLGVEHQPHAVSGTSHTQEQLRASPGCARCGGDQAGAQGAQSLGLQGLQCACCFRSPWVLCERNDYPQSHVGPHAVTPFITEELVAFQRC